MQVQAKVGKRYSSAISNELSRRIKAGNYKHMTLKNVIADPKFQDSGIYGQQKFSHEQSATDLMDMILDLPSDNPYSSHMPS